MLGFIISMVEKIWETDTELRDQSLFGESRQDRQSRRFVAWICGGAIALLILLIIIF
jgi:hypothetical protein